jgi:hypothetical protein
MSEENKTILIYFALRLLYSIAVVIAFVVVAIHFNLWWVSLFSIFVLNLFYNYDLP